MRGQRMTWDYLYFWRQSEGSTESEAPKYAAATEPSHDVTREDAREFSKCECPEASEKREAAPR